MCAAVETKTSIMNYEMRLRCAEPLKLDLPMMTLTQIWTVSKCPCECVLLSPTVASPVRLSDQMYQEVNDLRETPAPDRKPHVAGGD